MRIILVEDEKNLALTVKRGLEKEGYSVDCVFDGLLAQEQLEILSDVYDLVILDVMLPRVDGLRVCQNLRNQKISIPILMLTAKDSLSDKVSGLNCGADDYLVKPFAFEELLARIQTLLRRPNSLLPENFNTADLTLNPVTREVYRSKSKIDLTTKEFELLEYFFRHIGQVLNREQLIDHAWNDTFDSFSNIVDVHIKNLRKKIDISGSEKLFETVRGIGYRLKKIEIKTDSIQGGRLETVELMD